MHSNGPGLGSGLGHRQLTARNCLPRSVLTPCWAPPDSFAVLSACLLACLPLVMLLQGKGGSVLCQARPQPNPGQTCWLCHSGNSWCERELLRACSAPGRTLEPHRSQASGQCPAVPSLLSQLKDNTLATDYLATAPAGALTTMHILVLSVTLGSQTCQQSQKPHCHI